MGLGVCSVLRRKRLLWAVVAATTPLLVTSTASAAEVSGRPSPQVWRYGETRVVGFHVVLRTGAQAERVAVAYDSPAYAVTGEPVGGPLQDLVPKVSGAGSIDFVTDLPAFDAGRGDICFRGRMPRTESVRVSLPPSSTTVLRLRFRLRLPYPGMNFGLSLRVSSLDSANKVTGREDLRLPAPRLLGRVGVPIRFGALRLRRGEVKVVVPFVLGAGR